MAAQQEQWPSAMQVAAQRMVEGSEPGNRSDSYRFVAAAAPGGQGGAEFIASAFEYIKSTGQRVRRGYNGLKIFDGFRGGSSGIIVAGFGAASILEDQPNADELPRKKGQIELGRDIFDIHLRDKRFFDKSRLVKGALGKGIPAMDIEYLVYEIMQHPEKSPLNIENLQALQGIVEVGAYVTDSETGLASSIDLTQLTAEQILQTIHASAQFPFFAGPEPVVLWNGKGTDAGVGTHGAPIQQIIQENAQLEEDDARRITHVVIFHKESPGTRKKWDWVNEVGAILWKDNYPVLAKALRAWAKKFDNNMEFLDHVEDPKNRTPEEGKLNIQVVGPGRHGPEMPLASQNGITQEVRALGRRAMQAKLRRSLYALTGEVYA